MTAVAESQTDGRAELSVDGFTTAALERGDSAFVPADNGVFELIGAGTAFVVTPAVRALGKAR